MLGPLIEKRGLKLRLVRVEERSGCEGGTFRRRLLAGAKLRVAK